MDITHLSERLGLERDEFLELVELFLETGASDLGRLEASLQKENLEGVVKSSHSIKGASGNLGFTEIFEQVVIFTCEGKEGDGISEYLISTRK